MKTAGPILMLIAYALAGALAADDERAQPALTLTASNFSERVGATLAGEELQIAPTGSVACTLTFVTNQTCTVVVVARATAAAQLIVRLDTNRLATAAQASTNWTSHSFSAAVSAGEHTLTFAPECATNSVFVSSVTLIAAPLPQPVATNRTARPRWDLPVGR